jgi:hypothetical protein
VQRKCIIHIIIKLVFSASRGVTSKIWVIYSPVELDVTPLLHGCTKRLVPPARDRWMQDEDRLIRDRKWPSPSPTRRSTKQSQWHDSQKLSPCGLLQRFVHICSQVFWLCPCFDSNYLKKGLRKKLILRSKYSQPYSIREVDLVTTRWLRTVHQLWSVDSCN